MRSLWLKLSPKARTALWCVVALVGMLAFTAAMVPLYYLFCDAFGIPTPRLVAGPSAPVVATAAPASTRTVTVRFIANQASGMPVQLAPTQFVAQVRLGQPLLTAYRATNTSPKAIDGVALHMVYAMGGPPRTDINDYIDLQQCFCFELQHYPGSQQVMLPLSFTVRPNLPEGIHTITMAYTLFAALPNDPRIKSHTKAANAAR
jgi:cytochrome c oxidase assembly protein subunit 11